MKHLGKDLLSLIVVSIFSIGAIFAQNDTLDVILPATQFQQKLQTTPDGQLVDARTAKEYAEGHLANAENMDVTKPASFSDQIKTLDKQKPVFVYCLSGGRSHKAAVEMRKEGFEKVYEMQGGILKWRAADLPEVDVHATQSNGMSLQEFENKTKSGTVLVDYWAPWCGPCKVLTPIVEKVVARNKDKVQLLRINIDENKTLVKSLSVDAIPILSVYKNGRLTWKNSGLVDEVTLEKHL